MKTPTASGRPGVLLPVAEFPGTLAAARSLGRAGIPVTIASARRLMPARWSRYVDRALGCPDPTTDPQRFVDWLLELGADEPGLVLLPTSDDLAWLLARHRAALAQSYVLDSPPLDAVYRLLNKWRLREACAAVGIEMPATWMPGGNLPAAVPLRFPLLIKPQTQILLHPHQKGRVVQSREQLEGLYAGFIAATRYAEALVDADPQVWRPMLQELVESDGVYGLSGFIDSSGDHLVVSASRKVLQRPRVLGVGLCFQQAELEVPLAERLRALCRHVGYHGVFEVEFLVASGRHLMIDFNPRCYGQMQFDIARGADLPLMAYLHAVGDREGLSTEVELASRRLAESGPKAWCDRVSLELFMTLRKLGGRSDGAATRAWTQWLQTHRRHLIDAFFDDDDWLPGVAAVLEEVLMCSMHPRATWRLAREAQGDGR